MKTRIILWILFQFIAVFPGCSSLQGGSNAVCTHSVSFHQTRSASYLVSHRTGIWWWRDTVWQTRFRTQWYPGWRTEEICCPGYENSNGTCEPKCDSSCKNGHCAAPNTCRCNDGYAMSGTLCIPVCSGSCKTETVSALIPPPGIQAIN